jgi:hypothetical protein
MSIKYQPREVGILPGPRTLHAIWLDCEALYNIRCYRTDANNKLRTGWDVSVYHKAPYPNSLYVDIFEDIGAQCFEFVQWFMVLVTKIKPDLDGRQPAKVLTLFGNKGVCHAVNRYFGFRKVEIPEVNLDFPSLSAEISAWPNSKVGWVFVDPMPTESLPVWRDELQKWRAAECDKSDYFLSTVLLNLMKLNWDHCVIKLSANMTFQVFQVLYEFATHNRCVGIYYNPLTFRPEAFLLFTKGNGKIDLFTGKLYDFLMLWKHKSAEKKIRSLVAVNYVIKVMADRGIRLGVTSWPLGMTVQVMVPTEPTGFGDWATVETQKLSYAK